MNAQGRSDSVSSVRAVMVYIVALLAGLLAALLIAPLGLVVEEQVIWPLALALGGLVAGIGASLTADARRTDGTTSRMALVAVLTASIGAALGIVLYLLRNEDIVPNLFTGIIALSAANALDATLLAFALRTGAPRRGAALVTLALLAFGLVAVVLTVGGACAAGACGA